MRQELKIGDKVKWTLSFTEKIGIVVAYVLPEETPIKFLSSGKKLNDNFEHLQEKYSISRLSDGKPRLNHVSYLIAVGKYLYWPRISWLQKVEE